MHAPGRTHDCHGCRSSSGFPPLRNVLPGRLPSGRGRENPKNARAGATDLLCIGAAAHRPAVLDNWAASFESVSGPFWRGLQLKGNSAVSFYRSRYDVILACTLCMNGCVIFLWEARSDFQGSDRENCQLGFDAPYVFLALRCMPATDIPVVF